MTNLLLLSASLLVAPLQDEKAEPAPAAASPAVAAIEKLGGKVDHEGMDASKPIVSVNFGVAKIKDADLESLKGLDSLTKLTLNNNKELTDAALEKLKQLGLTKLTKLYLVDTKLTDAGLAHLKEMKDLQVLSLVGTPITDAGLEHLKEVKGLKELYLFGTQVTDEGVKKLKEALPELKIDK